MQKSNNTSRTETPNTLPQAYVTSPKRFRCEFYTYGKLHMAFSFLSRKSKPTSFSNTLLYPTHLTNVV